MGGFNGGSDHLSSVERYDPATNAWEAVAPMGSARVLLAVAVLDGNLYAVGGESNYNFLSSVERYDLAANAWEAVAPMGTERSEHGVAVLDGKLYAVGGWKKNNEEDESQLVNTVERYNPATNACVALL